MKKLLAAMFVALLMVGCGGGDVEGVRKSEELIGGQIFIVTKSRENVKLGLVTVKVFDEAGIEKFREKATSILEHRLARVDEDSRWDDFKEDWIDSAIAEVTPSAEAKTDADGRFLFTPPSDKFMLVAKSSRLMGDKQEEYLWLEIFQRDSIGPSGLLLSNDNLMGDSVYPSAFPAGAENRFVTTVSQVEERKRAEQEAAEARRWAEKEAKIIAEMVGLDDDGKLIAEVIHYKKLSRRFTKERGKDGERLHYAPDQLKPYTGWTKEMHDNGQMKVLKQYKDGKRDGLVTGWYENGQKKTEINSKDGEADGLVTNWYENGQKQSESNYKDGKRDGLVTIWYENGQKQSEGNCKDGKQDGLHIFYKEDGTELGRTTYRDGKLIED